MKITRGTFQVHAQGLKKSRSCAADESFRGSDLNPVGHSTPEKAKPCQTEVSPFAVQRCWLTYEQEVLLKLSQMT